MVRFAREERERELKGSCMRKQFIKSFEELISIENLLEAWKEFVVLKRTRFDVQQYSLQLMDNIISLHNDLANGTYLHGGYHAFNISDPKPRNIHKASVRDRLLHHALYRQLYPFFHEVFIADSFSCQQEKGVHRALKRFDLFARKGSKNNTRTCWVLKCDIRKFFANIDHAVLEKILCRYIVDERILALLKNIIGSFHLARNVGLPLGNLTSQLLVNAYMNEFDLFVKHTLREKYYIRYCDDFVVLSHKKPLLECYKFLMKNFLSKHLKLDLHPGKVSIRTVSSGVDFLGWVHCPHHRILRTTTKRRIMKRMTQSPKDETLQSYFGLLKHGATHKLRKEVLKVYLLNRPE